jgi:rhodanese-related sulfurtransferase
MNKWKVVDQGDRFGIGDTLRANAAIEVDRFVDDGDTIETGSQVINVLFTPGHTDNHISLFVEDNIFTGDLLLIGQAGRSDLPGGNPDEQYDSLFGKILPLADQTRIYPGHDYAGMEFALLGEERISNPFLQLRTKQQFVEFVKDFFPPLAENTGSGGKMTLQCGVQRVQAGGAVKDISARELRIMIENGKAPFLLDVREPVELAMSGAIEGVHNVSIRRLKQQLDTLPAKKDAQIVCVCQSGGRSSEAAHVLQQEGYTQVLNLSGGTSGWIQAGFPVVTGVAG